MPPYHGFPSLNKPYSEVTQWMGQEMNSLRHMITLIVGVNVSNPSVSQRIPFTEAMLCSKNLVYLHLMHHQNVNRSGSHTQTSQTLRSTTSVCLSTSRCSQAPLELRKVLWDSTREFSGAPSKIVKFSSCWDICEGLQETSRASETSVQLCGRLDAVFLQRWLLEFHNHEAFRLSYSCLLQSHDSLHSNMACIIYHCDSGYIHMVNLPADGTQA